LEKLNEEEMKSIDEAYKRPGITHLEIARLQDRVKDIFYKQKKFMLDRA
jgi:hypothetical protein